MATHEECLQYLSDLFVPSNTEILTLLGIGNGKLLGEFSGGRLSQLGIDNVVVEYDFFDPNMNHYFMTVIAMDMSSRMVTDENYYRLVHGCALKSKFNAIRITVNEDNEDTPEYVYDDIAGWAVLEKLKN